MLSSQWGRPIVTHVHLIDLPGLSLEYSRPASFYMVNLASTMGTGVPNSTGLRILVDLG